MSDREQAIRAVGVCPGCGYLGGQGITKQDRYWHADCWIKRLETELARLRPVVEAAREVLGTRFDDDCRKPDCAECVAFRALVAALAALDGER